MELLKQKSILKEKTMWLWEPEYRKQVHQVAGKIFGLQGIGVCTINL